MQEKNTSKTPRKSMKNHSVNAPHALSLDDATGTIDYCATNDYMFRALMQSNGNVLKHLICALLHLKPSEVSSVAITNPIELGKHIDDKHFILDIKVLLNDSKIVNLEMQMANLMNWSERSLSYLCRSFDQLNRGQDYSEAKTAIHIGFLNFTPFSDCPEFYATYKLLNIRNHHVYSDKFILSVVDLTQIDSSTEEDAAWGIDYWAKLFKARTWEELRMIAKKSDELREASEALYVMNADQMIREQCLAREDYYRLHNSINRKMEMLTSEKEALTSENKSLTSKVISLSSEKEALVSEKEVLSSENDALKKLLAEHGISY